MATYPESAPQQGYPPQQGGYPPQQGGYPPQPMYTAQPMYAAPAQQFIQVADVNKIRDWLPWSIINLIFGWGLGGILPLIFSIICRSNKRSNDVKGARTMSTLALVFNILITLGGIAAWIGFIVWLVIYIRVVKDVVNINYTYP